MQDRKGADRQLLAACPSISRQCALAQIEAGNSVIPYWWDRDHKSNTYRWHFADWSRGSSIFNADNPLKDFYPDRPGRYYHFALKLGADHGRMYCVDVDTKHLQDPEAKESLSRGVLEVAAGYREALMIEVTRSGGLHLICRVDGLVLSKEYLRDEQGLDLIELLGDSCLLFTYPQDDKYKPIDEHGQEIRIRHPHKYIAYRLERLKTMSADGFHSLVSELALLVNPQQIDFRRSERPQERSSRPQEVRSDADLRPGSVMGGHPVFVLELLMKHGWQWATDWYEVQGGQRPGWHIDLVRPGKSIEEYQATGSASAKYWLEGTSFVNFSSACPHFGDRRLQSIQFIELYAVLECAGDRSLAARELSKIIRDYAENA